MTSISALVLCTGVSLVLSLILAFTSGSPLRAFIQRACPGPEGVNFSSRFTLIMLFLSPLFFSVAFGLPPAAMLAKTDMSEVFQRAVTSSIIGAFVAMLAIGLWVSAMARRQPPGPPPARAPRTDDQLWRESFNHIPWIPPAPPKESSAMKHALFNAIVAATAPQSAFVLAQEAPTR